jgi:transcription antitermination factor NusG
MKLVTGDKRWFVVQTFTGSESEIADELRKVGIEAYVPRFKEEVRRKHGYRTIIKPLLPSYLFVAMPDNPTLRHFGRVSDIDGVIGFLKNQGTPLEIAADLIVEIQVREMEGEFDKMLTDKNGREQAKEKFPVGSKAELTAGTFAMLIGTILKHEKTGRIKLEVDVYGRAFVVDADPEKLRPAA